MVIFLWTFFALGAAALVMVATGLMSGRTIGVKSVKRDVRAGLEEFRAHGKGLAAAGADAQPVNATFDEFFAGAQVDEDPYLRVDDLTDTLAKTRDLASRGVDLASRGVDLATRGVALVRR
ncbi:hypothetical protein [Pengzhenrongella sp.]|jgi:hypothetical protein|uniref:hypothetical protein n=1 Tax=Pengzhenrongella sp. TaxID=2888820 RepID=UPI002F94BFE3